MNFNKIKLHNIRKTLLRSTAAALCAVTISASAALSVSAATASTAATNAATSAVNGTVQSTTAIPRAVLIINGPHHQRYLPEVPFL